MVHQPQPPSPIRLALVTTELRPGGAERCLTNLAIGLDRTQFEPQIYVLAGAPPRGQSQLVELLQQAHVPVHFLGAQRKSQFFGIAKQLRAKIEQQGPHVVQSFLFHANVVSAMATRKLPVSLFGGLRVAQRECMRRSIERRLARGFAGFVCVSQAVADHAAQRGKLPREKLPVIPNGIDVAKWQNVAPIDWSTLGISPTQRVILFVGRLDAQKGADILLDAAARFLPRWPQHDVALIGDGKERTRLITFVKRCQLSSRIHFAPWRADIASCLAGAELVVLPSRFEGMSNVLLEAMAAAKPVVAANVEGVAEVLGALAARQTSAPNSAPALASAIEGVLGDPAFLQDIGAANRARVAEHYSLERMIDAYADLYVHTVSQHQASS